MYVCMYMYMLSIAMSELHEIKHEARGRDANKALGKVECFISIKAARRMIYLA